MVNIIDSSHRHRRNARTGRWLWRLLPVPLMLGSLACQPPAPAPKPPAAQLAALLGEAAGAGFTRADAVRPLQFPADHADHGDYRHEWWYLTGNLHTASGQRLGYQLTFFRFASGQTPAATSSAWRSSQIYMAHFAVSDLSQGRFFSFERFSRAALGLAGSGTAPLRVWLNDWSMQGADDDLLPLRLQAQQDEVGIELLLQPGKAMVLQGDRGWSRKGPEAGNASYYYSFTRLPSRGSVRIGAAVYSVSGDSWFDHEWGSSTLAAGTQGWDWFALQLDDGRELMFYRLRASDGSSTPFSQGVLVLADGQALPLQAGQVKLGEGAHWQSPRSGVCYPAAWVLSLADHGLDLAITPLMPDQEMNHSVRYWEGAVQVRDNITSAPRGVGYVELAGYDGPCAR